MDQFRLTEFWRMKRQSCRWNPHEEDLTVRVSESLYDAARPGDAVWLSVHQGALGVRWFTVSTCR